MLSSVASRTVLVPFQWYSCPKKAPKEILPTFFPCIFSRKTKWNSLQILRNKNYTIKVDKRYSLNTTNILNSTTSTH